MRKIKPTKYEDGPMAIDEKEMYPRFSIDTKHLPEAKKWEIGEKYYVTLEVIQTGLSIHEHKNKEIGYADFDIIGIEAGEKKEKNYKELPDVE